MLSCLMYDGCLVEVYIHEYILVWISSPLVLDVGLDFCFDLPLDEDLEGWCDVRNGDKEPFLDVYLCEEEEDSEEFLDLDRVADLKRSIKYVSL